jgi:hypothetical protein
MLRIGSSPPGAAVTVNGRRVGRTPIVVRLPLGRHHVRLEQGGRQEDRTVRLIADEDLFVGF